MPTRRDPKVPLPRSIGYICVLLFAPLLLGRCAAQIGGSGLDDDPSLAPQGADGGMGEDIPIADPGPRRLVSLRMSPDNDVLLVDLQKQVSRSFTVSGLFSDRTSEDLTSKVTLWASPFGIGSSPSRMPSPSVSQP